MKRLLDKIAEYITDNEKIGAYLFLFIFVTRIFLDLVIEKILGLGEEWQHYIFAFYKYNYVIVVGYMFIYEIFYLYRFHKFHFTKIQWIGILYAFVAIIATYAYLKDQLAYDYYTKLSLGEMIMTSVFMFDVGSKLSPKNFEKVLVICAKFYLSLTSIINFVSLAILFLDLKENFILLGRSISIPFHFDKPASLLGTYPYAGFYYNTSITGPCCSLAIFLLVWLLKAKKIQKGIFVALTFLNLYCLFLSSNRTGIIGLAVFLLLILLEFAKNNIKETKKRNALYMVSIIFITGLLAYFIFKKRNISHVFNTLFSDPIMALDNLGSSRMRILQSIIRIVKERPLLGNGWNSEIPIEGGKIVFPYAHNIFLGALAWTGILGFIVFIYFYSLLIKHSSKASHTSTSTRILFFLIVSLTIECQFENGILGDWNHAYTYLFWYIAGFLCTLEKKINKNTYDSY